MGPLHFVKLKAGQVCNIYIYIYINFGCSHVISLNSRQICRLYCRNNNVSVGYSSSLDTMTFVLRVYLLQVMKAGVMNKKTDLCILAAHLHLVVIREMLIHDNHYLERQEAPPVASGTIIYYTGKAKQWVHAGCIGSSYHTWRTILFSNNPHTQSVQHYHKLTKWTLPQ